MSDPKRLIDELGPGLERDLLSAASAERAPSAARQRVALGLFGAPALAPIAAAANAASPAGAGAGTSSLLASALKWLAVGAVAGGVSGTMGSALFVPERAPPTVEAPRALAEPAPARVAPPKRAEAPVAPAAVTERAPSKPQARTPEANEGTVMIGNPALATEAASLERIRVLSRRDPRRALAELEHHDARFSAHGVLADKSRALRAQIVARGAR